MILLRAALARVRALFRRNVISDEIRDGIPIVGLEPSHPGELHVGLQADPDDHQVGRDFGAGIGAPRANPADTPCVK